jgi:hypothetical protein
MLNRKTKALVFALVVFAHVAVFLLMLRVRPTPRPIDNEPSSTIFFIPTVRMERKEQRLLKSKKDSDQQDSDVAQPIVDKVDVSANTTEPTTDWHALADDAIKSVLARKQLEQSRRLMFSKSPSQKDLSVEEKPEREALPAPGSVKHLGGGDFVTGTGSNWKPTLSNPFRHLDCYVISVLTAEGRKDTDICRSTIPPIDLQKMVDKLKPEYLKRELPVPKPKSLDEARAEAKAGE